MDINHHLTGLADAQVAASREKHGINVLTPPKKESLWSKFLKKFTDPLIIVLLVAGALSVGISFYECYGLHEGADVFFEPIGIFIAILLATGLSFYFETKADREFAILNRINDDEPVRVLRGGNITEVPKRDIVVGDIVYLDTGDEVPADGRLLEAVTLTMDESTLTGEPACHKTADPNDFDPDATYSSDQVLRGTKVIEGHGVCCIERVGDATESGKVFTEAQIDNSVKTPLDEQFEGLGLLISRVSYVFALLIVVGRCIAYYFDSDFVSFFTVDFGAYFLQSIMIAVTLIVVSVPEGLPMAVTLSLAYSMRRMLRTNNLVRRLHACETMGAATVICTDKTGTLTQNQMQVAETDFFPGVDPAVIEEGIAVNSTAVLDLSGQTPKALGNPTEGALILWLHAAGKDYSQIRECVEVMAELPFTTERKFMAAMVKSAVTGRHTLYVKGAPEIVLGMCRKVAGDVPREDIDKRLLSYQNKAMRTLGFAYCQLDDNVQPDQAIESLKAKQEQPALEFVGMVAISDPVRSDVPDAVKECLDAGIAVKIVTGDTPATACEIGRQIGLVSEADGTECVITGPEFASLTDEEMLARVDRLKIIARARPTDKKRLVEGLQQKRYVVAVTGDGTNDAPALKAAHVGLSMGDGTSVAKEASDITIVDNSFASIGRAVMWGRSLYRNIQRFILFQMTVNVAACFIVLAGAFIGTESPLTVTQMLWVNLIMDTFAAMALASLPPSESVMRDKPRDRNEFIISRPMMRSIVGVGGIFFFVLLGLLYIFVHSDITSLSQLAGLRLGPKNGLTSYEISLFFTIFVFLQFWNMFNARAFMTGRSALRLKDCGEFLLIVALIFLGQIAIVEFGARFFSVHPLLLSDWAWIICATSLVLWIGEAMRHFCRNK